MTKVIKICDRCKKEADWLYTLLRIVIAGLTVETYKGETELCEKCARNCIEIMEEYQRGEL